MGKAKTIPTLDAELCTPVSLDTTSTNGGDPDYAFEGRIRHWITDTLSFTLNLSWASSSHFTINSKVLAMLFKELQDERTCPRAGVLHQTFCPLHSLLSTAIIKVLLTCFIEFWFLFNSDFIFCNSTMHCIYSIAYTKNRREPQPALWKGIMAVMATPAEATPSWTRCPSRCHSRRTKCPGSVFLLSLSSLSGFLCNRRPNAMQRKYSVPARFCSNFWPWEPGVQYSYCLLCEPF